MLEESIILIRPIADRLTVVWSMMKLSQRNHSLKRGEKPISDLLMRLNQEIQVLIGKICHHSKNKHQREYMVKLRTWKILIILIREDMREDLKKMILSQKVTALKLKQVEHKNYLKKKLKMIFNQTN